jgi:hypothetical protein
LFVFVAIFSLTLVANRNGVVIKILHVLNLLSFFSCGFFVFISSINFGGYDPPNLTWEQIDYLRAGGRVYRNASDGSPWASELIEAEFGVSGAEQIDAVTFFRCDFTGIFCQGFYDNVRVKRDHRIGLQAGNGTIYVIDEDSAEIIFIYETP